MSSTEIRIYSSKHYKILNHFYFYPTPDRCILLSACTCNSASKVFDISTHFEFLCEKEKRTTVKCKYWPSYNKGLSAANSSTSNLIKGNCKLSTTTGGLLRRKRCQRCSIKTATTSFFVWLMLSLHYQVDMYGQ